MKIGEIFNSGRASSLANVTLQNVTLQQNCIATKRENNAPHSFFVEIKISKRQFGQTKDICRLFQLKHIVRTDHFHNPLSNEILNLMLFPSF